MISLVLFFRKPGVTVLTAHIDKSHANDDAMLTSLTGEPLMPMMGIVCAGVSMFLARALTSGVGG
jgi:hypothetical protein